VLIEAERPLGPSGHHVDDRKTINSMGFTAKGINGRRYAERRPQQAVKFGVGGS